MYSSWLRLRCSRNAFKTKLSPNVQIRFQHTAPHAGSSSAPPTDSSSATVSKKATSIPESILSYHWETSSPTSNQLHQAERFFLSRPPVLLYSSTKFRTVETGAAPEVTFLGRSNVGKSSLLNALMGRNICHTSSKPGRTRTMNFFAVGGEDQSGNPGKIVILDMPGYGKGSREEWGPEIMKYLVGRKQLRRTFLLVDAQHGLKSTDEELLDQLRRNGVSHQIILSKVDRILLPGSKIPSTSKLESNVHELDQVYHKVRVKIQPGMLDGPEALGEIISCSAEKSLERGRRLGINQVRWAVLAATGLNLKGRRPPNDFTKDEMTPAEGAFRANYVPYGHRRVAPLA